MNDQQEILYLLSGNGSTERWWEDTVPHFQRYQPQPLELPGSGDNMSEAFGSLDELAVALLEMTQPGHALFVVGVNALVALRAEARSPGHFSRLIVLAPVGAFLGDRKFVKWMAKKPARRTLHFLLSRYPKLFRRKFSDKQWPEEHYQRMGDGYTRCRAFEKYFEIVQPYDALDLFEWITAPVDLIWGAGDAVLGIGQAAAWDAILPRAELTVTLKEDWGHYPYIDDPQQFAAYIESFEGGFPAHTKAGRLQLATLAGLPVPKQYSVSSDAEIAALPELDASRTYAVRSSGATEDHIDHSHAGRNTTFLRVPTEEVAAKAGELIHQHGLAAAVVQEFIEPRVSGVAFCRQISLEIEYVEGHLEALVDGSVSPHRAVLAKMGGDWSLDAEQLPGCPVFDFNALAAFLRRCLKAFHYHPADIEWAWDGTQFYMLQTRPVTSYAWRRCLTSANLDEILPAQVSRLMEHAQRGASLAAGRVYAICDPRTLHDHEPFSSLADDASYINVDLFVSRLYDWGLPSSMLSREMGGAVPRTSFSPWRFAKSLPLAFRLRGAVRKQVVHTVSRVMAFEKEFDALETLPTDTPEEKQHREAALVQWFVRFYVFILRQNIFINTCIATAGGSFLGAAKTVYQNIADNAADSPHRLKFESDPATPRPVLSDKDQSLLRVTPLPEWSWLTRALHYAGSPGLCGRYTEIREWFRDNNMKLFFRLHHALKDSDWLLPHEASRQQSGAFWQAGGETLKQDFAFVIYPGAAEGIVGRDILIVDALEPGHFEDYRAAAAVIARTGGRLSHGATLLREIKKPSAVMQQIPGDLEGQKIRYANGQIEVL